MTLTAADDLIGTIRLSPTGEVRIAAPTAPDAEYWHGEGARWISVTKLCAPLRDVDVEYWQVLTAVPCSPAAPRVDMRIVKASDIEAGRAALDRLHTAEEAMAGMVSELDAVRADLTRVQESRQAWAIEADNQTQLVEILRARLCDAEHIRHEIEIHLDRAIGTQAEDGAGAGLAADVALLVQRYTDTRDRLARAHQYIGGLLLADPTRFPGSAEHAAERVVDLDPPPAGLTARVQHIVNAAGIDPAREVERLCAERDSMVRDLLQAVYPGDPMPDRPLDTVWNHLLEQAGKLSAERDEALKERDTARRKAASASGRCVDLAGRLRAEQDDNGDLIPPALADVRVRFRFWCCPAHDKGTVDWRDDVAHCTTDDCDITSTTLKTPAEWSVLDRVIIHGADGWRGRDAKPFTEPITYTEFLRRMSISSIERRKPFPPRGEVPRG